MNGRGTIIFAYGDDIEADFIDDIPYGKRTSRLANGDVIEEDSKDGNGK